MPDPRPFQASLPPSTRRIFWALFGLSLAFQALIYGVITDKPVIRSDGVGYHMYLPALADRDLSLRTLEQREFPEGIPYWTGTHPGPSGYVIKYPLGEALLQAPFFLLAHLVASLLGLGSVYAYPYQWATALAGAFYFAWGGRFMWILLRREFAAGVSLAALGFTVLGTNVLHYATYDAGFSHVYSFFLGAALLVTCRRLAEAPARQWLVVGALSGLTVVTRPTNIVFLIFVVADWFLVAGSWGQGLRQIRPKQREILYASLAAVAPICLQLAYWKAATGHWLFYAYGREGFNFLRPALLRVLFSLEKGWFVYIPLAGVAGLGWFAARKKLAHYFPALPVFAVVNVWIIASWHDWGYGGSFVIRPLMESGPLVALGLAGALWRCADAPGLRRLCLGVCVAGTVYTFVLMLGYWMRTLPYIQATGTDILNCLTFVWLRR